MKNDFCITLALDGLPSEDGYIRAGDFLRELQLLTSALNKTDRDICGTGGPFSYYRIVNLSLASPATVVLEALPRDPDTDMRSEVISKFFSVLSCIQHGEFLPESVSHSLLQDLSGMASPVGKSIGSVRVSRDGTVIHFNPKLQKTIELLLAPEEIYPGAIRGMLEAINLHREANVFRIYPDVGPAKITCHFAIELQEQAVKAINHFVEVRGILKYKVRAQYPHEIQVDSIEAFPPEHELPSLWDIKGIAPNATGQLASEDFVRELRNAT